MYEPWVKEMDLTAINIDSMDPDYPNAGTLTKFSKKQARTGVAMIKCVCESACLRKTFADYLNDTTPHGLTSLSLWFRSD